ncbi:hypothetical protein HDU99_009275, partial [Rhizoclosmatium hyalinum]
MLDCYRLDSLRKFRSHKSDFRPKEELVGIKFFLDLVVGRLNRFENKSFINHLSESVRNSFLTFKEQKLEFHRPKSTVTGNKSGPFSMLGEPEVPARLVNSPHPSPSKISATTEPLSFEKPNSSISESASPSSSISSLLPLKRVHSPLPETHPQTKKLRVDHSTTTPLSLLKKYLMHAELIHILQRGALEFLKENKDVVKKHFLPELRGFEKDLVELQKKLDPDMVVDFEFGDLDFSKQLRLL